MSSNGMLVIFDEFFVLFLRLFAGHTWLSRPRRGAKTERKRRKKQHMLNLQTYSKIQAIFLERGYSSQYETHIYYWHRWIYRISSR